MKPRSLRIKLTLWFAFVSTTIVLVSDFVCFRLVAGRSGQDPTNLAGSILWLLAVANLITVVASVAGGYLIIGRALRPVDYMADRAREIGSGNLQRRLESVDSSLEMSRLAEVLNEMFDRLQRLIESQRQFVQDASHEMRSPLAAIRCRLEVALRQSRSAVEYRQIIASSLEDVTRMTALAEDLFLLARADSNNLAMEFREVSLAQILKGVFEQLRAFAEANEIELKLNADSACLVYADATRIHRAFRNVVENALKYTPRGGSVSITVRPEGEYVVAQVADTGIGIPKEEQPNIFRRFYRIDPARSRGDGGTGLGLAICDQIVRAHQGRIELQSGPGAGTRFTIYLASAAALLDQPL